MTVCLSLITAALPSPKWGPDNLECQIFVYWPESKAQPKMWQKLAFHIHRRLTTRTSWRFGGAPLLGSGRILHSTLGHFRRQPQAISLNVEVWHRKEGQYPIFDSASEISAGLLSSMVTRPRGLEGGDWPPAACLRNATDGNAAPIFQLSSKTGQSPRRRCRHAGTKAHSSPIPAK